MNKTTKLLGAFALLCSAANAAQTLQFSTSAGRGTRFATATAGDYGPLAGVDASGLRWGIVVDTGADGFDGDGTSMLKHYGTFTGAVTANQALRDTSNVATDDLYFASANVSSDSSGFGLTGVGAGGPGTFGNIAVTYTGISAGQRFALFWFNDNTAESDGDKYGLFTDPAFVLPGDAGGSTAMGAIFSGPESSDKLANITFGAVPEPSRLLLLGFGLIGVLARRRR